MANPTSSPALEERLKRAEAFIKTVEMPAQAGIVIEINKEVTKAEPDIKRITDLVTRDVSVSSAVIKTINSPYFGMRVQVVSINQALTLLGLKNFHKVVLAGQLQNVLGGGAGKEFKKFWDHFMGVAKSAELVAKTFMKLKFFDIEDYAFMAGLFHDCGIPLLISKHPNYVLETFGTCAGSPDKLKAEEIKRYGFDHASLSYVLAKSWGIHDGVCRAILHHHTSEATFDDDLGRRVWILLRLSDYLAEFVNAKHGRHIQEYNEFNEKNDMLLLPEALMDQYDLSVYDIGELREYAQEELVKYMQGSPIGGSEGKNDPNSDKKGSSGKGAAKETKPSAPQKKSFFR